MCAYKTYNNPEMFGGVVGGGLPTPVWPPMNLSGEILEIPFHHPLPGAKVKAYKPGKVVVIVDSDSSGLKTNLHYIAERFGVYSRNAGNGYVMTWAKFAEFMPKARAAAGKAPQKDTQPTHEETAPTIPQERKVSQRKGKKTQTAEPSTVMSALAQIEAKYAWIEQWESDPKMRIWRATIQNAKVDRRRALAALEQPAIDVTAEFEAIKKEMAAKNDN